MNLQTHVLTVVEKLYNSLKQLGSELANGVI